MAISTIPAYQQRAVVTSDSVGNTSVAKNTAKTLITFTLPAGRCIVICSVRFSNATSTGSRQACYTTTQDSVASHTVGRWAAQPATGDDLTYLNWTNYENLATDTTMYLNVYHTHSAALNVAAQFTVIKLD